LPSLDCLGLAIGRRAFDRAFRGAVDAEASLILREAVEERARIERGGAGMATSQRRD